MNVDIRHIARLARLRIDDDKLEEFEKDMDTITEMVRILPDIEDEKLAVIPEETMRLREDAAEDNKFTRDELIKNAPETCKGYLTVPKTVE